MGDPDPASPFQIFKNRQEAERRVIIEQIKQKKKEKVKIQQENMIDQQKITELNQEIKQLQQNIKHRWQVTDQHLQRDINQLRDKYNKSMEFEAEVVREQTILDNKRKNLDDEKKSLDDKEVEFHKKLGLPEQSTNSDASHRRDASAEAVPVVTNGSNGLLATRILPDNRHPSPPSSTSTMRDADSDAMPARRRQPRHAHNTHLHESSVGEADNNTIEGESDSSDGETVTYEHEGPALPNAETLGESLPDEGREGVVDQAPVDGADTHTGAGASQDSDVPQNAQASRKRARPLEDEGEHRASTDTANRSSRGQPLGRQEMTFEEVYRDTLENPTFKNIIVERRNMRGSLDFYIVPCQECGMTWEKNPLRSAGPHLSSAHNVRPAGYDAVIQHLGILVTGCDMNSMRENNELREKMIERKEYKPKTHVTQPPSYSTRSTVTGRRAHTRRQQSVELGPDSPGIEDSHQDPLPENLPGQPVLDPVRGTVYKAWRQGPEDAGSSSEGPGWCFATPLPFGDLAPIGMTGNFRDTPLNGTNGSLPECYDLIDQDSGMPIRWGTPFEDGGPRAARREIPMLLLMPGVEIPPAGQEFCMTTEAGCRPVAWVEVRYLREEYFQPPHDQPQEWVAADGRAVADAFKARLDGLQLHRPLEPPEEPVAQPEAPMDIPIPAPSPMSVESRLASPASEYFAGIAQRALDNYDRPDDDSSPSTSDPFNSPGPDPVDSAFSFNENEQNNGDGSLWPENAPTASLARRPHDIETRVRPSSELRLPRLVKNDELPGHMQPQAISTTAAATKSGLNTGGFGMLAPLETRQQRSTSGAAAAAADPADTTQGMDVMDFTPDAAGIPSGSSARSRTIFSDPLPAPPQQPSTATGEQHHRQQQQQQQPRAQGAAITTTHGQDYRERPRGPTGLRRKPSAPKRDVSSVEKQAARREGTSAAAAAAAGVGHSKPGSGSSGSSSSSSSSSNRRRGPVLAGPPVPLPSPVSMYDGRSFAGPEAHAAPAAHLERHDDRSSERYGRHPQCGHAGGQNYRGARSPLEEGEILSDDERF